MKNDALIKRLRLPLAILLFVYGGFRVLNQLLFLVDGYGNVLVSSLLCLCYTAADVALGYFALVSDKPERRRAVRPVWFVPAAACAVGTVISWISDIAGGYVEFMLGSGEIVSLLMNVVWAVFKIVAIVLMTGWLIGGTGEEEAPAEAARTETGTERDMSCGLVKHTLLLLFTFGVWNLIWIYRMTGYLNRVPGEEPRSPVTKLLLCMFVPFYSIYWTYKSAQRVDKLANDKKIHSDLATPCLVLSIFVGIVPPILMQDRVNAILACG